MRSNPCLKQAVRCACLIALTCSVAKGIAFGQASAAVAAQPSPAQVISPEVTSDRRVVFRILAPSAKTVTIEAHDMTGQGQTLPAFVKDGQGVWEATSEPVPAGAYRYFFQVDGVPTVDPRNPAFSQSNSNLYSLVVVPGADFVDDRNEVSHGAVSTVYYASTTLGRQRRAHVYTPPGYETSKAKYPVLYLLHGSSDSDDSWTSVGRANFLLDNLIAAGKAVPMIVVMPAGHTSRREDDAPPAEGKRRDEFLEDFTQDLMPYIAKRYRVLKDRRHTAIAGLSMGGGQTIDILMALPGSFAYVGVWSAGVFADSYPTHGAKRTWPPTEVNADWVQDHTGALGDQRLKGGLKLFSFSIGQEDSLLPIAKVTVAMFQEHGFKPVLAESEGGHYWSNWRNYLNDFAPKLFR
jgi:enterochelin esterase-like enzyme